MSHPSAFLCSFVIPTQIINPHTSINNPRISILNAFTSILLPLPCFSTHLRIFGLGNDGVFQPLIRICLGCRNFPSSPLDIPSISFSLRLLFDSSLRIRPCLVAFVSSSPNVTSTVYNVYLFLQTYDVPHILLPPFLLIPLPLEFSIVFTSIRFIDAGFSCEIKTALARTPFGALLVLLTWGAKP